MPYQRLIFTLHYDSGQFCLSRNFRLQRVGNVNWLVKNYDLPALCAALDELVILNVTRSEFKQKFNAQFFDDLSVILENCFCPVSIGGGVNSLSDAKLLFSAGADKVIVSSALISNPLLPSQIAAIYGSQAITLWLDCDDVAFRLKANTEAFSLFEAEEFMSHQSDFIGDVVLHSIQKDGTAQGFKIDLITKFSKLFASHPLIISGGAGKYEHFAEALDCTSVSGVSTANLLNFIGSDMIRIRHRLIDFNYHLARW